MKPMIVWVLSLHRVADQIAETHLGEAGLDLSPTELVALALLARQDALRASDVAAACGFAATSFTPVLDGLERGGWIVRRNNPADRRSVLIHLTEKGQEKRTVILAVAEVVEKGVRAQVDQSISQLPVMA